MKDTMVVTTEVLPKREPIVVNRDLWYSFVSKEDADPQACWLERKRQERMKAEKAVTVASRNSTSSSSSQSSYGSLVMPDMNSLTYRNVQKKVNRNQNQTPSPATSVSESFSDDGASQNLPKSSSLEQNKPGDVPSGHIQNSIGNHYANIGEYLNKIYNREQICDISFKTGKVTYPVHKVVLASQSTMFEKLFDSKEFTQAPIRPKQIKVNGVSEGALKTFLNCIYSGNINLVKPDYLPEILELSRLFKVPQITQMCLQKTSSLRHCDMLELLQKMRSYKDIQLCDILMDAIAQNFMEIRNCSSFYNLDVDTICMIMSSNRLDVNSEMDIFESAVGWLHHHKEERMENLERVMDLVRFSLLSSQQLMECFVKCPALKQSPHCVGLITMANWVQTSISLDQQDPLNLEVEEHRSLANSGGSVEQYLSTQCSSEFKEPGVTFDIITMTEQAIEDFNRHACAHSSSWSTISANHIKQYSESKWSIKGDNTQNNPGKPDGKVLAWLKQSEQAHQKTFSVSQMIEDHNHPKPNLVTGLQSMDCLMGRKPKQNCAPKMERKNNKHEYHFKKKRSESNQTEDISNSDRKSVDYRKAMVWGGDRWYMVGGARYKDSKFPCPTGKVLQYSFETREWTPVANMNEPRMEHSLCFADGLLYAIGGIGEGNRPLSSMECYNPRTNCWFYVKALPEPRVGASASAKGGNVCLKGGYREIKNGQPSSFHQDDELYNVDSNKWTRNF